MENGEWVSRSRNQAKLFLEMQRSIDGQIDGRRHGAGVSVMAIQIAQVVKNLDLQADLPSLWQVYLGGLMHDGGKGENLEVYNSVETMTEEEKVIFFWNHPIIAASKARSMASIDYRVPIAIEQHHEKLDGTGYPNGLVENQIILLSRIYTIADMWDALRNRGDEPENRQNGKRCFYKTKWDDVSVQEYLGSLAGEKIDQELLMILFGHYTKFTNNYVKAVEQGYGISWRRDGQPVFAK